MLMRTAATIVLCTIAVADLTAQGRSGVSAPTETYDSATVTARGDLLIVTASGRRVVVRKEREQTEFSTPVISSAGTAVAAQAMFRNCCTSYDIPLQLVVYARGRLHRFTGVQLPIFQWAFADGGTQIAYGQEPVHFGCSVHYELRDIASGRLIDKADVPEPCGPFPNPEAVKVPGWVTNLISQK
jgi:hypothetical protein